MVRALTDILWTGSDAGARVARRRRARVYYAVLAAVVVWGIIALRLAQPIVLLQIGANVAGVVFIITSLHLLYINTRLLPPALRPPCGAARRWSSWRCSTGSSRCCRSRACFREPSHRVVRCAKVPTSDTPLLARRGKLYMGGSRAGPGSWVICSVHGPGKTLALTPADA